MCQISVSDIETQSFQLSLTNFYKVLFVEKYHKEKWVATTLVIIIEWKDKNIKAVYSKFYTHPKSTECLSCYVTDLGR